MKTIVYIMMILGFLKPTSLFSQVNTITSKPDVKINVKITRDKDGNIISYDSTYVKTWSSNNAVSADSIMNMFNNKFADFAPFGNDLFIPEFNQNSTIESDSLNTNIFDNASSEFEYFQKQMLQEMMQMQKIMQKFMIIPNQNCKETPQLQNNQNNQTKPRATNFI